MANENCVCGHPREDHFDDKACWYSNCVTKCITYHPEQPNIDTSGEREDWEVKASEKAYERCLENVPIASAVGFSDGFRYGWSAAKAQVIDEFVRRVEAEIHGGGTINNILQDTVRRKLRSVAEEMKGEKG